MKLLHAIGLLVLLLGACSSAKYKRQMGAYLPTKLTLECREGNIFADISITNNAKDIQIDKIRNGMSGVLIDDIFEIKSLEGKEVRYTGFIDDYEATEENLSLFAEGEKISFTINLSKYYEIIKPTQISVTYRAGSYIESYKDKAYLFEAHSSISKCPE